MPKVSYCSKSKVTLGSRNSKISWGSQPQMRAVIHEGDGDCTVAQMQSSRKDHIALLKQAMAGIIISPDHIIDHSLENDQDCLITSQGLAFSLPKTKVHVNVHKMNLR